MPFARERFVERAPVRKPGERVGRRDVLQLLGCGALLFVVDPRAEIDRAALEQQQVFVVVGVGFAGLNARARRRCGRRTGSARRPPTRRAGLRDRPSVTTRACGHSSTPCSKIGLPRSQDADVQAFGMRARIVGAAALALAEDELDARFPVVADGDLDDRGVNVGGKQRGDLLEELVQRQISGQQKRRPSHEVPVTFRRS